MPDPYQQVSPGDQFSMSATAWNDVLVMLADWKKQRNSRPGGFSNAPPNPGMALVYNNTSNNVARYGVLWLNPAADFSIDPNDNLDGFLDVLILNGLNPVANTGPQYVIALEPIPQGTIGRAQAFGPIQVQIQVTTATNGMLAADVLVGDTTQLALVPGGFKVVLIDDYDSGAGGTQTLWGIVNLGQPEGILAARMDASQDGTHPVGQYRTYDLLSPPGSTAQVQVLNEIGDVQFDARTLTAYIAGINGIYKLITINACGT
jgi:hypothetical protein